jgi:hypothetical protein
MILVLPGTGLIFGKSPLAGELPDARGGERKEADRPNLKEAHAPTQEEDAAKTWILAPESRRDHVPREKELPEKEEEACRQDRISHAANRGAQG